MDPYWPQHPSTAASGLPVRRKMRSKSGSKLQPQDPIMQLMMSSLMERQSLSLPSAAKHCSAPEQVVTHQTQPFSSSPEPAGDPFGAASRGCCRQLWQKLWFRVALLLLLLVAVVLAIALPLGLRRAAATRRGMQPPQYGLGPRLNTSTMTLVFADDFTTGLDAATWNVEIGDGADYGLESWGNKELQCYTSSPNNLDVIPHPDYPEDDGVLRIRPVYSPTAQPCSNQKAPNSTRQWTSAKVDTKNKIAFTWSGQQVFKGPCCPAAVRKGQPKAPTTTASSNASSTANSTCGFVVVESRMKLPFAAGRWSALWMMPLPQPCPSASRAAECGAFGSWPASGEIDIVEQVNTDTKVLGTVHYADKLGFHQWLGGSLPLSQAELLDWNIYQLVWDCRSITWYVNTMQVYQVTRQQLGNAPWPFDEPFFLILNTAVGGWLTGNVAPDQGASQPFLVDYVRVYAAQQV